MAITPGSLVDGIEQLAVMMTMTAWWDVLLPAKSSLDTAIKSIGLHLCRCFTTKPKTHVFTSKTQGAKEIKQVLAGREPLLKTPGNIEGNWAEMRVGSGHGLNLPSLRAPLLPSLPSTNLDNSRAGEGALLQTVACLLRGESESSCQWPTPSLLQTD